MVENAINLGIDELCIVFDYYGIEKYYKGDWLARNEFIKSYIIKMRQLSKNIKISMCKVSSHTGVLGNEKADRLAKRGAKFPNVSINVDKVELLKERGNMKPQKKLDYLKRCWKTIFKYLTIIEMMYLNSNINGLDLECLVVNIRIKAINLEKFLDKNFNLFEIEDHMDPIDDRIVQCMEEV
jgi:hypothetical protein